MLQAAQNLTEFAPGSDSAPDQQIQEITLLELVTAVAEHADSDAEVVATVAHLLNTGRVKLVGNFLGKDVRVA